jgi:membrane protein DedA with SNARE-associated domain
MSDWVIDVVKSMGWFGIALLTLLENIFPPIPSEVIMPLAGYISASGDMNLGIAITAGSIGSLVGCTCWYIVGRKIGEDRLRAWIDKSGYWVTLDNQDIDKVQALFKKHGAPVVFFGRLIPGIRTWISVPAGLHRMHPVPFLLWSALGTVAWTALLTYAGYLLGSNFENISGPVGNFSTAVFIGIAASYVYRLIRRWPQRHGGR